MEKFNPFFKAALEFVQKYEKEMRDKYKILQNKSAARDQVLKHRLGDLWGMALALQKSLDSLKDPKVSKHELTANIEAQVRNTFECLSALEKYNREEYKSEAFSRDISQVYSIINPNDIKELSASAVQFLDELA